MLMVLPVLDNTLGFSGIKITKRSLGKRLQKSSQIFLVTIGGSRQHFMDIRVPCEDVSEELTRELLIAISYSVPEKAFDLDLPPEKLSNVDSVSVLNGDITDHYRSELISISNAQSVDVKI